MIPLSDYWLKQVTANAFPEMTYHVVSVILRDGRRFDQVVIDRGDITKVRGANEIPFSEDDIKQIISPYDKWLRLPIEWAPTVVDIPESGMGYTFVLIHLLDGRIFDALISSGFVTKVKGFSGIPFRADEIKCITTGKRFD